MKKILILVVIVFAIALTGCSKTIDIGKLNDNPKKYLHQDCVVEGIIETVINIPGFDKDFFKIYDVTGEIWIYTEKGVPPKDKSVKVRGKFLRLVDIPLLRDLIRETFKKLGLKVIYYIELEEIEFL